MPRCHVSLGLPYGFGDASFLRGARNGAWCWSGIGLSEQCVPSRLCPFDLHFGMGVWSKLVGMRRPVNALASPWLKPIEFILGNCL